MAGLAYFALVSKWGVFISVYQEMSSENSFFSDPPSDISACKTLSKNMFQCLNFGSIFNLHNEQV